MESGLSLNIASFEISMNYSMFVFLKSMILILILTFSGSWVRDLAVQQHQNLLPQISHTVPHRFSQLPCTSPHLSHCTLTNGNFCFYSYWRSIWCNVFFLSVGKAVARLSCDSLWSCRNCNFKSNGFFSPMSTRDMVKKEYTSRVKNSLYKPD
ncbi:hypothetical protein DEO72_LG3g1087 [Vigna unguiculata]|uniref:Uncharacterized protein n=1 Tax=Vigna unguiculata TaxID=3917 RepID=A0A4D6LDJ0_VIGUN|nr:hypothetical protein DEO72_LG3g1087 [Vigna unguiculata]